MQIRSTTAQDITALQNVVEQTGLFPPEMLPDMLAGFLSGNETSDIWLTCETETGVVGLCYAVPEQLADGAWNMLALAVSPEAQGQGCSAALVQHLEDALRKTSQRILIADTSSGDDFARARAFYTKNGFAQEACIRDYWAAGEDKITFWKSLST